MNDHASMNRIYRLVWSQVHGAFIPVAETARGRGKGRSRAVRRAKAAALSVAVLGLTCVISAHAGPTGGQIVTGKGNITQSGSTTDVHQSSQNLSIDWLSFNVAPSETVDFIQPSASAIAVNRIGGNSGSQILGRLESNGQVYLINPNGVLFGKGSEVNVGGLVASTLDVSDASLNGSDRKFSGNGSGIVVNEGAITAASGGSVALVGSQLSNQGSIRAQLGTVAMGAGSAVTITFAGDKLLHLTVERSVLKTLAENRGLIQADGGQILMTAGAKDALLASVVNNSGVIEARTVEDHEGSITLLGGETAGSVNESGVLDASAANGGGGGRVETSGAQVKVTDSARVTTAAARGMTGSWDIDPNDFTVAASGGDISGAKLSSELAATSVTIASTSGSKAGTGSINVNDTVSWKAHTLTLDAADNVNVNAIMTASGVASLALNPDTANGGIAAVSGGALLMGLSNSGFGGAINFSGSGTLAMQGTKYTVINSLGAAGSKTGTDLQGIEGKLSGHYVLGSNINASATSSWNSGAGFNPLGNATTPFTGVFNGLGHTINGLFVNRPTQYVGLFGRLAAPSMLSNVGVAGGSVSGGSYFVGGLAGLNAGARISNSFTTNAVKSQDGLVGGLVGFNNGGAINNSFATGSVSSTASNAGGVSDSGGVGGLVGESYQGTIANSHATGSVSDAGSAGGDGGLVGVMDHEFILNSYATGKVSGRYYVGGLVGENESSAAVIESYARGGVSGNFGVGGLVGLNQSALIQQSYATGSVFDAGPGPGTGIDAGGLVGTNAGMILDSYATGSISSVTNVGGLVGLNLGTIQASYSKGQLHVADIDQGKVIFGGLVGSNSGTVTNSYWDTTTSEDSTSAGGKGLNSAQMATASSFAGFAFTNTAGGAGWVIVDADGTLNNAGGAGGATAPMLASEYSTTITNAHQLQLAAMNARASYTLGQNIDASGTALYYADVWYGAGFVPIARFSGTFDGLGHTIVSLTTNTLRSDVGLFGSTGATAVIRNVGLVGGSVAGSSYVGGLVGDNYGSISNSYTIQAVTGYLPKGAAHVGGLVGDNESGATIASSYVMASVVSGGADVGGLVGFNSGRVLSSHATGQVVDHPNAALGTDPAGGLVGGNDAGGAITSSYATGGVLGSGADGGLVGRNSGAVTGSYATGGVMSTGSYAGGLIGVNTGTVLSSHATGSVTNSASSAFLSSGGGLVGGNSGSGTITTSYATGAVSGSGLDGGLVGYNAAAITNSYATGAVSDSGQDAGGLVGGNQGSISNSHASGAVTAKGIDAGGLVGASIHGAATSIVSSYATGKVSGTSFVGGLVGWNYGNTIVDNSYATGAVSGSAYVGGFAGRNAGTIANSYSAGKVTGTIDVGGFAGENDSVIASSFWDTTTSGRSTSSGGTGMSTANMHIEANFISATAANGNVDPGWNFTSIWEISNGKTYPTLRPQ